MVHPNDPCSHPVTNNNVDRVVFMCQNRTKYAESGLRDNCPIPGSVEPVYFETTAFEYESWGVVK